jgi:hypothetical protein
MALPTAIGALYRVPAVSLGVLPSVVYRIAAPVVVVLMVTLCIEVYAPDPGLNAGAATGPAGNRMGTSTNPAG